VKTADGNVYFIRVGSTIRKASPIELALLFESGQQSSHVKKPELELLLINEKGEAVKEIHVEPTFVKKILKKVPRLMSDSTVAALAARSMSSMYEEREPPEDLIPIGIQIANKGGIPAHGVRLTLTFPAECDVIAKRDAVGGISIGPILPYAPNSGGLFTERDEKIPEAYAWIDTLGNDLTCFFEKIYVRFPQVERQYKIQGHITQHGFPPRPNSLRKSWRNTMKILDLLLFCEA
jgi:hypothetical protein